MSVLRHTPPRSPLVVTFLVGWALVTLTLLVAMLVDGHASLSAVLVYFLFAPILPAMVAWNAVTGSSYSWLGAVLLGGYAVSPLALAWAFMRVGRAARIALCCLMALWWAVCGGAILELVLNFPRS